MPGHDHFATEETITWLLEGDPSVRWQTHAHILDSDEQTVATERAKVAVEGWGAHFLRLQNPDSGWGGGLYTPKWTSTHYTLLALRRLGLPPDNPQAGAAARLLLDEGFRADHGIAFHKSAKGAGETCISGMGLSMFSYFGLDDERLDLVAGYLLDEQMADGGWNCRRGRGATHSSFHTTCSVLEGLADFLRFRPGWGKPIAEAITTGQEFLLEHRLYRSHTTGEVVSQPMTRFPFPPQWQYDIMRALDHFVLSGASPDVRAGDAIDLVISKADEDGRWHQYRGPNGVYHFPIEQPGHPSRANTLRALRALRWWEG